MIDLIDRQAIIDALSDIYKATERREQEAKDYDIKARARAELCKISINEMKLKIEELSSAQPEQGVWIKEDHGGKEVTNVY